MAVNVVSFSFFWCSTGALGSTLLGAGFLYCILSASSLDPNSSGLPEGPFGRVWLSLPHLVSNSVRSSTPTGSSNSAELYNRSTPTRSLKSNVYSSSSGNNCHAVQRSLSSGSSLCSGTVGLSPGPILSFDYWPWNVSLPSGASHWNRIFGPGRRSKYYIITWIIFRTI